MPAHSAAEITVSDSLPPVDVEMVSDHVEGVINSYINYRLFHSATEHGVDSDRGEAITDAETGRRLAVVAEQFDQVNSSELQHLVERVTTLTGPAASTDDWFSAFRLVVDGVLMGEFSWTKLVLVLCFGYRLLQRAWKNGWRPTFGLVSSIIVRYILQENVLRWLAQHGGWLAASCLKITRNMDLQMNIAVGIGTGIAAALLSFSFIYLVRRRAMGPP